MVIIGIYMIVELIVWLITAFVFRLAVFLFPLDLDLEDGRASAEKLTPEQRKTIAPKAAQAR